MRQIVNWGWLICCLTDGEKRGEDCIKQSYFSYFTFQLKLLSAVKTTEGTPCGWRKKLIFFLFHVKFLNAFKIICIKHSSRKKSLVLFLLEALWITCEYGISLGTYWLSRISLNVWHSTACSATSFEAWELPQFWQRCSDICDWSCRGDWKPKKV